MNYLLFLLTMLMSHMSGSPMPEITSIVIDKPAHTLYGMTAEGDTVVAYDCALGRNYGQKTRRGDWKTPEGEFKVVSVEDSSGWEGDASGSDYGPWFLRLGGDTPWHSIGIHGTNRPPTVGTRASMGCIRLHNSDLLTLKHMVSPGCAVTILPDTITTDKTFTPPPKKERLDKGRAVTAAKTVSARKKKSRHRHWYPHKRRRRHHR